MKKNTIRARQISHDCWALDEAFYQWLKERLPVYLKQAGKIVDLQYCTIEHDRQQITQRQAINRMIDLVNYLTDDQSNDWSEEYDNKAHELCDIWNKIHRAMWW